MPPRRHSRVTWPRPRHPPCLQAARREQRPALLCPALPRAASAPHACASPACSAAGLPACPEHCSPQPSCVPAWQSCSLSSPCSHPAVPLLCAQPCWQPEWCRGTGYGAACAAPGCTGMVLQDKGRSGCEPRCVGCLRSSVRQWWHRQTRACACAGMLLRAGTCTMARNVGLCLGAVWYCSVISH